MIKTSNMFFVGFLFLAMIYFRGGQNRQLLDCYYISLLPTASLQVLSNQYNDTKREYIMAGLNAPQSDDKQCIMSHVRAFSSSPPPLSGYITSSVTVSW